MVPASEDAKVDCANCTPLSVLHPCPAWQRCLPAKLPFQLSRHFKFGHEACRALERRSQRSYAVLDRTFSSQV
eukprot:CAMPEP_0172896266 /NCGR_PEP_ID=MMETSP1075-20121228/155107_1 /TAXON_ID=2916 /ORGANISM="Ceratium fusus, Strain PA161109" /LENGTH=72 /DNA_ID=CAMNT_0013751637 /DNA_START=339 /DNA_END=557 /DNA_ORIENTATION=+